MESMSLPSKTNIMPALSDADIGPSIIEDVRCGTRVIRLERPATPEQILDLDIVADAYQRDEYMPYWAALWPVATALAEYILVNPWPLRTRAIELGCGLGLPGIAALLAGCEVTFTDYDETALQFAARSAQLNGYTQGFRTLAFDWREPLAENFDLIIASDLIYEQRHIGPLVRLFSAMLAPHGVVLVADQNRAHAALFTQELAAASFNYKTTAVNVAEGGDDSKSATGTLYRIERL